MTWSVVLAGHSRSRSDHGTSSSASLEMADVHPDAMDWPRFDDTWFVRLWCRGYSYFVFYLAATSTMQGQRGRARPAWSRSSTRRSHFHPACFRDPRSHQHKMTFHFLKSRVAVFIPTTFSYHPSTLNSICMLPWQLTKPFQTPTVLLQDCFLNATEAQRA